MKRSFITSMRSDDVPPSDSEGAIHIGGTLMKRSFITSMRSDDVTRELRSKARVDTYCLGGTLIYGGFHEEKYIGSSGYAE